MAGCPWAWKSPMVEDIMSPLCALASQDEIGSAARRMMENNAGGAAVLDASGRPVGVLSKSDIARYDAGRLGASDGGFPPGRAAACVGAPEERPLDRVADWMTPFVVSVPKGTPTILAVSHMLAKSIHRIFVSEDYKGRELCGVVTIFDVLGGLAEDCPALRLALALPSAERSAAAARSGRALPGGRRRRGKRKGGRYERRF